MAAEGLGLTDSLLAADAYGYGMTSTVASGTEVAIFGTTDVESIRGTVDALAQAKFGSGIGEILFRAGRVDAVWAVRLDDGRDVVVKAHRQPVDLLARRATVQALRFLSKVGFPCPTPLADTSVFRGLVFSCDSLVTEGASGDAHEPAVRRALAQGLADHVRLLRGLPGIVTVAGSGPAWCRYQEGPWPTPHDPIFDFDVTPDGYDWLDEFASEAAARLTRPHTLETVVGHADWYAGNARFDGDVLVGTFDWDLVAAPEAQIAGFAAATYTDDGSGEQDLPAPAEVRLFLGDYESARGVPFAEEEQIQAAAAASWALAYNARCQLSFLDGQSPGESALGLLRTHGAAYLQLPW